MSAGAVDVLAVLRDEYVALIALSAMVHPSKCYEVRARADKIHEVRAAFAELIEALNCAKPEIQQAEFVLRNAGATVTADYLKQRMEPLFAALGHVGTPP